MAHSVFPHHHRVNSEIEVQDTHHHHGQNEAHHHHHGQPDDQSNDGFTFGKLDHAFLTGKQLLAPVAITVVIEVYNWTVIRYNAERNTDTFYIKDVELPPWIRCQEISFRGPPTI